MKTISLSRGFIALVDDEDYEYLRNFKWHVYTSKKDRTQYVMRSLWRDGKKTTITMHQDILNHPVDMVSDHRNGNGLDNQRHNLRRCSQSNNCMNRRPQKGTSCFKGVSIRKNDGIWRSRIKTKGKIYHLGYFQSEIDAALAYNVAAQKMFGEYARLNSL